MSARAANPKTHAFIPPTMSVCYEIDQSMVDLEDYIAKNDIEFAAVGAGSGLSLSLQTNDNENYAKHVRYMLQLASRSAIAHVELNGDGGALYRARVAELISQGRAFARIEDGRVIFKAEVGAATAQACQIQGVWVDPGLRGRGLANGGMAAVVAQAQESIAPVVSLYVNDFNAPARAAYTKVGFAEVGTFMSVLF